MGPVWRGVLWVHSDSRKVLYLGPTGVMIGTLARTSWKWCWWWCTCKLGVCTKSLVAFEIWWAFLDTPQLGIPSNSLFDWKNSNMEFAASNPNPSKDERKLLEVVPPTCYNWVDCSRGWLSVILLLSLTSMPPRPTDCTW